MRADPTGLDRNELADQVRRALDEAQAALTAPAGSPEAQAEALIRVAAELERLERRLPDDRSIQLQLRRTREAATVARDRLWAAGRKRIAKRAVGLTLGQRTRRTQKAVDLLTRASQLDREGLPALRDDLSRAARRLSYLEAVRVQARATRGRRLLVYGALAAAALGLVALLVWALGPEPGPRPAALTSTPAPRATPSPSATPRLASSPPPTTSVPGPTRFDSNESEPIAPTHSPSPTPTSTAQPSPGPVASPTLPPLPTPRPTPTSTPTLPPTETAAVRSRSTGPAQTPAPSATATPTAGLAYPAPELLQPEDVVYLAQRNNSRYTMRWQWAGELKEDEWFDIRIGQPGLPHHGVAWTKSREYEYDICLKASGDYYWTIAVIRGRHGQWLSDQSPEAAPRRFSSSRSDDWCLSHNRFVEGTMP